MDVLTVEVLVTESPQFVNQIHVSTSLAVGWSVFFLPFFFSKFLTVGAATCQGLNLTPLGLHLHQVLLGWQRRAADIASLWHYVHHSLTLRSSFSDATFFILCRSSRRPLHPVCCYLWVPGVSPLAAICLSLCVANPFSWHLVFLWIFQARPVVTGSTWDLVLSVRAFNRACVSVHVCMFICVQISHQFCRSCVLYPKFCWVSIWKVRYWRRLLVKVPLYLVVLYHFLLFQFFLIESSPGFFWSAMFPFTISCPVKGYFW